MFWSSYKIPLSPKLILSNESEEPGPLVNEEGEEEVEGIGLEVPNPERRGFCGTGEVFWEIFGYAEFWEVLGREEESPKMSSNPLFEGGTEEEEIPEDDRLTVEPVEGVKSNRSSNKLLFLVAVWEEEKEEEGAERDEIGFVDGEADDWDVCPCGWEDSLSSTEVPSVGLLGKGGIISQTVC